MSAGLEGLHRNVPLSTQLAERMRDRIDARDWPVGMRIPSESALVAELGVSRNSVREALRSLVHAGLLEARPGDGTYVRAHSELRAVLERRARRSRPGDAAEVRSMLECQGARLASMRATAHDVATIRAALTERDRATDARSFAAADVAFHRAVVAASGNALLAELHENLEGLTAHIEAVSATPDFATFLADNRELNACHDDLLAALVAGDADRAEALAAEIVRRSYRARSP